jgi:hypothetical protein
MCSSSVAIPISICTKQLEEVVVRSNQHQDLVYSLNTRLLIFRHFQMLGAHAQRIMQINLEVGFEIEITCIRPSAHGRVQKAEGNGSNHLA